MLSLTPESTVRYLQGVGEKRASYYEKLDIYTVTDLLYHFPRRYIDLTNPFEVMTAPLGETVPVKARLMSKSPEQHIRKGLSIFRLVAEDSSGVLEITMFNARYRVGQLQVGQSYVFHGPVEGTLLSRTMSAPMIYDINDQLEILPVYPQTAGIQTPLIRRNVQQVLEELAPLPDAIPEKYRIQYDLGERNASLRNIHFPRSMAAATVARNRFIFEELLTLSCSLYALRFQQEEKVMDPLSAVSLDPFYQSLPYRPTDAQYRCVAEATKDMMRPTPMNRLIQGDVGSGKTMVAAACIYFAAQNQVQSAMMVPTEILAEQHYQTLTTMLSPFGLTVALLTGSTPAAQRRQVLAGLSSGEIHLCVGTHALLSDSISFDHLGLVITDEQHRFGVAQRATLSQKSENAHVLVMSATPIPRTLSLIIYGDLSLSILDEMPAGRQEVDTLVIDGSIRSRALGFVRDHADAGRQTYIVCPLVEESEEDVELKSAVEYAEELANGELRGYKVGLLHGQMSARDKEKTMRKFKDGHIQVLVTTTVIEVGVDVPNATIMMVENAERFGLSQLHQLRGRVGRGRDKSYCILVSDTRGKTARQRLHIMRQVSDGFELAEHDLKLRGPGDFFGYRQHGLPTLKVANLADDIHLLEQSQECAQDILQHDPQLAKPVHRALKKQVDAMLDSVGQRPN